jgi:serine protease Do
MIEVNARMGRRLAATAAVILALVVMLSVPAGRAFAQSSSNAQVNQGLRELQNIQSVFREVARKVIPSVVQIDVVDVVRQPVPTNPFQFFFGPGPQDRSQPQQEREFRQLGLGSGVIVRRDGQSVYVLTNNHVVGQAEEISVKLSDGRSYKGKLVGKDDKKDLALVVFQTSETVPIAELGDSDNLQVGDWVLAVGSPLGFASTVTSGIVSAMGRESLPGSELAGFTDYVQTDAAINQGNSGGALVNIYGQVVGINTWIASPSGGNVGLGFAIPINNAKKDIESFLTKGKVEYGWLGIYIGNPQPGLAEAMHTGGRSGAFVTSVFLGSPADKAGILPGDLITAINGTELRDAGQLLRVVGDLQPDATARFALVRYGSPLTLSVKIGVREDEKTIAEQARRVFPGIYVAPITADVRKQLNLGADQGQVFVAGVQQGSAGDVAGIKAGDVILRVNNERLSDLLDFYKALNRRGGEVRFHILRQGAELTIGLIR